MPGKWPAVKCVPHPASRSGNPVQATTGSQAAVAPRRPIHEAGAAGGPRPASRVELNSLMRPYFTALKEQKACAEIKSRGGTGRREAVPIKGGSSAIAFVEDTDDYKIELIERKQPHRSTGTPESPTADRR